ncbi:hypothetical protein Micbo1qcDRAFT_178143 [Microdochium bolleyi]|uniref:Uncharacterized protein n=1 Tax=Microdochium bolleyi TaxID=196109 RepID=A0A136IUG3_9PEZI|nr:hypothetical protein Micbo1qcDRAFT_178143 [Microdochium bolleyi]
MCYGRLKNHGCGHIGVRWDHCPAAPTDPITALWTRPCGVIDYSYPPRQRSQSPPMDGNKPSEGVVIDWGAEDGPWECSQCLADGITKHPSGPCKQSCVRVQTLAEGSQYLMCGREKCPAVVKKTLKESELLGECYNETTPAEIPEEEKRLAASMTLQSPWAASCHYSADTVGYNTQRPGALPKQSTQATIGGVDIDVERDLAAALDALRDRDWDEDTEGLGTVTGPTAAAPSAPSAPRDKTDSSDETLHAKRQRKKKEKGARAGRENTKTNKRKVR